MKKIKIKMSSLTDRLVDLVIATIFEFLTLKDIKNVLLADTKLRQHLKRRKTKLYLTKSLLRNRKLQEKGISVGSLVSSVAWHPNGKRIVSGSEDGKIRQFSAITGKRIGKPLTGHTHLVRGIAYSPDGKRIVSGSNDTTIRQWDAKTGKQIGEPMTGHRNWVWSVAYSPDGKRIVSGSFDNTIRQWNAETGDQIGEPLRGHTYAVMSVAYSPEGTETGGFGDRKGLRIVSGSHDHTVRQWDANTGEQIGDPLIGHTDWVHSVAWSPILIDRPQGNPDDRQGLRIVSGSSDGIVIQWNAFAESSVPRKRITEIGIGLTGHTGAVTSVAYSADDRQGLRIVSGSWDTTIRQWNAETGTQIGEPLRGHTDLIWSVSYSSDGKRIVSGSFDKTIRIWQLD